MKVVFDASHADLAGTKAVVLVAGIAAVPPVNPPAVAYAVAAAVPICNAAAAPVVF